MFSTGSRPASAITLGGGVTITADPPVTTSITAMDPGSISVNQSAVVYTVTRGQTTVVLGLYSPQNQPALVDVGDQKVPVRAGQAVFVMNGSQKDIEAANLLPNVGFRNVARTGNIITAEFSMPSALTSVSQLKALLHSSNSSDVKLARKLMKTAAILQTMKAGQPFKFYQ